MVETGVQEDRTSVLVDVNEVVVEVDVVVNQYSKNLPCLKKCIKKIIASSRGMKRQTLKAYIFLYL